jgi:hypothetical protein
VLPVSVLGVSFIAYFIPKEPPSLKEALIKVATLGGFLGRTRDGMPGTQTLWRGLERLSDITSVCSIFFDST